MYYEEKSSFEKKKKLYWFYETQRFFFSNFNIFLWNNILTNSELLFLSDVVLEGFFLIKCNFKFVRNRNKRINYFNLRKFNGIVSLPSRYFVAKLYFILTLYLTDSLL